MSSVLRAIALRLVTSDGTRAVVDRSELEQLGDPAEVRALLDHLVGARLLAVGTEAEAGGQVEIVHESLLAHWPSLRRWRDEVGDDTAYLEQLRAAAKQWDSKQRARGLLWSGDALDELRAFDRRTTELLPPRERAFVDAALAEQGRAARRRRNVMLAGLIAAGMIAAAAVVALVLVRGAEQKAREQRDLADRGMRRAEAAEADVQAQLDLVRAAEARRLEAERAAAAASTDKLAADEKAAAAAAAAAASKASLQVAEIDVAAGKTDLEAANKRLVAALAEANGAKARAEEATRKAEAANTALKAAVEKERKRAEDAEKAGKGLTKVLKP